MLRPLLALFLLLITHVLAAQEVIIDVSAAKHAGEVVQLYRYDDLFTLRPVREATAIANDSGHAQLRANIQGTPKLRLRIGEVTADLFARAGAHYRVTFQEPDARTARTLSGTTRTTLTFHDLDPLDVNALTTDLNERVDAFVNEDLATDQVAGMQVLEVQRSKDAPEQDSLQRPPTLFVTPALSKARVDSFEVKLRKFYGDVNDPWFDHYLTYSVAGMRYGPRVNEAELYIHYLKDRPVRYDDPEYVRFLRSFFSEHLYQAHRYDPAVMEHLFGTGKADTLKAHLARNDFLKNDDRLCELVMIDLLYQQYNSKIVQRAGAELILSDVAANSRYPEHRSIAGNMLWDLVSMRVGSKLPSLLLEDAQGRTVQLDTAMAGATCIAITAGWCSYCDVEIRGLEQLARDYAGIVPITVIGLDTSATAWNNYVKQQPLSNIRWLRALAEQRLREDLRLLSLPAFYLLNDGILARSPAPLPSKGLGALFHQAKVNAEKDGRIKVWDD